MRDALAVVFLTTVVTAATASAAHAQDRRGFWIGTSLGLGTIDASAAGVFNFERSRIGVLDIETGWTVSPHVLIGLEMNAAPVILFDGTTRRDVGVGDFFFTLTYYPRPSSGLFVKGGAGPSFAYAIDSLPADDVHGNGVGAIVGVGYDVYLGRNFSLVSGMDFRFGRIGSLTIGPQAGFSNWTHNVLDVTVGIKFN